MCARRVEEEDAEQEDGERGSSLSRKGRDRRKQCAPSLSRKRARKRGGREGARERRVFAPQQEPSWSSRAPS